jgi:hypothetical protein
MKPYRENLAHAHQIWDVYEWPHPNLDASLWHSNEYKLFKRSHYVMQYSFVFTSIINPSCCFACCIEIRKDIEAHVDHGIHKGMHEHLVVDKCDDLVVAKCPPWMG